MGVPYRKKSLAETIKGTHICVPLDRIHLIHNRIKGTQICVPYARSNTEYANNKLIPIKKQSSYPFFSSFPCSGRNLKANTMVPASDSTPPTVMVSCTPIQLASEPTRKLPMGVAPMKAMV